MPVNTTSQRILTAVYTRLSASVGGLNANFAAKAATYGIPATYLLIDWTATSQNFFYAQADGDLLDATNAVKYPLCCLYILESAPTNEQKFTQFSGLISCIFDVWLSWKSMRVLQVQEAYAGCVEDSVFDAINRLDAQNWGKPLVYNGQISCRRGPLRMAGENLRQQVGFRMLFGLHE